MRRAVAVLSMLSLLSGCELLKGLQNRKVLGAVVLQTPGATLTQLPGAPSIAPSASALLFFGERQDGGAGSSAAPAGVSGATVTVSYTDGGVKKVVPLGPAAKAGQYQAAPGSLSYVAGAIYTFSIVSGTDTFEASVTAPAAAAQRSFQALPSDPPNSYAEFTGMKLTFDQPGPDELAFYSAWQVSATTAGAALGDATCTNLPISPAMNPSDLVGLVLDTSAWQKSTYTLAKADCFGYGPPSVNPAPYVVGLGMGRKGTFSDNLFSGSVVLAAAFEAQPLVFVR